MLPFVTQRVLALWVGVAVTVSSRASEPMATNAPAIRAEAQGGQSLGQAAEDPTASLMSVQVADWYTAKIHGLDDESANNVVVRSAIPFKTGDLNHIFRVTVPFITDHPALDEGLSDITLFDLMVFDQKWGRWGVGPVALLPTGGSGRGTEQWALGPAVGFTAKKGKFLWGAFNQNLFTYAGDDDRTPVNASVLQPILSYGLGHGWSVGCSEMTVTYDWQDGRWSSLPVGAKIAKLVKVGKLPIQASLQYEHDYADHRGDPEDIVRFTMKFLFPRP
jgi:hypothetical protein